MLDETMRWNDELLSCSNKQLYTVVSELELSTDNWGINHMLVTDTVKVVTTGHQICASRHQPALRGHQIHRTR